MRQIIIDELSPMERDNIDSYLKRSTLPGPLPDLYWLELPAALLAEAQQEHPEHGPFRLAVELCERSVRFELLVRSHANLHCSCIAHASPAQRQFILDFIDAMVAEELIRA